MRAYLVVDDDALPMGHCSFSITYALEPKPLASLLHGHLDGLVIEVLTWDGACVNIKERTVRPFALCQCQLVPISQSVH